MNKVFKITVGVLAVLGMVFVGLIMASLIMGYGPFTYIGVLVAKIPSLE